MSALNETACVYSALILQEDEIAITAEKINTILKAAKIDIEPYWPTLFAKALEGVDLKNLIANVSSGVGAGGAGGAGAAAAGGDAAAPKEEEKKEEKKEESEESDDDMGFGLFD